MIPAGIAHNEIVHKLPMFMIDGMHFADRGFIAAR
jgi:hypothetical protein